MIYKAYLKQCGGGCDYTIGCAQRVIPINASNIEEAKEMLYLEIEENYTGEYKLELCEIYEINEVVTCDLKEWYKRIDDTEYAIKQKLKEDLERKEFERLKAKFEKQIMTKFYIVRQGGRQCLMQGEQKTLYAGDIICSTNGYFMLKLGNALRPTVTTCMFCSEVEWENEKYKYKEIEEDSIDFIKILKPLIPHMTNGKKFKDFAGDIKSETKNRIREIVSKARIELENFKNKNV